jgi:alkylated DNA repair dioxygenase AlkB
MTDTGEIIDYTTEDESGKLNIRYHSTFMCAEESFSLFSKIYDLAPWPKSHFTKTGCIRRERNKVILGDDAILNRYTIEYKGQTIRTKVWPWAKLPFLEKIRDKISSITGQIYHCCVIQLYNNGSVGIKPHRDKEMEMGTIIASISLGATRTMRFERHGYDNCDISLSNGSLLLINPPTNNYWLHSIPWESGCKEPRMSLIFRNCKNMLTD